MQRGKCGVVRTGFPNPLYQRASSIPRRMACGLRISGLIIMKENIREDLAWFGAVAAVALFAWILRSGHFV